MCVGTKACVRMCMGGLGADVCERGPGVYMSEHVGPGRNVWDLSVSV